MSKKRTGVRQVHFLKPPVSRRSSLSSWGQERPFHSGIEDPQFQLTTGELVRAGANFVDMAVSTRVELLMPPGGQLKRN
jgi:hypothetical protein